MHYVVRNTEFRRKIPGHSGETAHYFTVEHGRYHDHQGDIIKKHLSISASERQANFLNSIVKDRDVVRDNGRSMYYVIQKRATLKEGGTKYFYFPVEYRKYKGEDSDIQSSFSTLREAENYADNLNTNIQILKIKKSLKTI